MRIHVAADQDAIVTCRKDECGPLPEVQNQAWRTRTDEPAPPPQAQEAPALPEPGTRSLARMFTRRYRGNTAVSLVTAGTHPDPGGAVWQWEHRTGYKNYDLRATARIEDAFQRGLSRVRLKAGKLDDTPMELFFYDMIQFDPKTGNCRKIRRIGPNGFWQTLKRKANEIARLIETGRSQRVVFAQYERKRQELHKGIDQIDYNVCDYYHEEGCIARIAKSSIFFVLSMLAVVLNAFWMGLEADLNTAPTISQADPGFQAVEHVFCLVFSLELVIRFGAFRRKRDCIKDGWFAFDTILVTLTVSETWLLPIAMAIMAGDQTRAYGVKELSILRTVRLLRLTRLGRIARLLRAVPELLTLLKGIGAAMPSVFYTLLLLLILLFVSGVVFKTQSEEDDNLAQLFPTVPASMWLLLLSGTFLDGPSAVANQVLASSPALAGLFLLFIFLSSYMVLNMLIGILCDVVHQVAVNEKEEAAVSYLKNTLLEILECHDKDNDRQIHRDEFELLMRNPEMHYVLTRFGVNVVDLITLKDVLYEDKDAHLEDDDESGFDTSPVPNGGRSHRKLSFSEFLEVVLRLRGGNSATVTDIVDLREYVRQRLDRMDWRLGGNGPGQSGAHLRTLRTMKSSSAASPNKLPRPIEAPARPLLQLQSRHQDAACEASLPQGGQSVEDMLLLRLAELSAGQREIAAKQAAWQNDMAEKQAALAEGLEAAVHKIAQVVEALEAREDSAEILFSPLSSIASPRVAV